MCACDLGRGERLDEFVVVEDVALRVGEHEQNRVFELLQGRGVWCAWK